MVAISDLLRRQPGLIVRACPGALDREIRWVHVSELTDPTPYLRGGELVLTAGVHLPDRPEELRGYARRLAEFGVAGVGFGIAPVQQGVPPALVHACEKFGLPLLEVPSSIAFITISEVIAAELEAGHLAELRRLNEAQRALVNAAARRRPIPAIVTRLADQLQAGVELTGPGQGHSAGPLLPAADRVAVVTGKIFDGTDEVGAALHEGGLHLIVVPVIGPGERSALIVGRETALNSAERGIVRVATSLLSLVARSAPRETGQQLGAAVALAAGGAPASSWELPVARALGASHGAAWHAVACVPPRGTMARSAAGRWREAAAASLGTPLAAPDGDGLLAVLPVGAREEAAIRALADAGSIVAVSEPVGWPQITDATAQARQRLITARIAGPSALGGAQAGELRLANVVDEEAARALATATFEPVRLARPKGAATLLMTLRAWLGVHGGWDAAAAELGVHRNTVRNRIALVGRLLDCDLNDPDVRMHLWFALRWAGARERPSRPEPT